VVSVEVDLVSPTGHDTRCTCWPSANPDHGDGIAGRAAAAHATDQPVPASHSRPGRLTARGIIPTNLRRDLHEGTAAADRGRRRSAAGRSPDYGGFMPVRAHPPADTEVLLNTALNSPTLSAQPA
jgi:hypothetical protein